MQAFDLQVRETKGNFKVYSLTKTNMQSNTEKIQRNQLMLTIQPQGWQQLLSQEKKFRTEPLGSNRKSQNY